MRWELSGVVLADRGDAIYLIGDVANAQLGLLLVCTELLDGV